MFFKYLYGIMFPVAELNCRLLVFQMNYNINMLHFKSYYIFITEGLAPSLIT